MKTSMYKFLDQEFIRTTYQVYHTWYTLDAETAWPQDQSETTRPKEKHEDYSK